VLRDATRIKYYAGSEMGAWVATNTRLVEETAIELREAHQRFLSTYESTDPTRSSAE
jgi:UDPglucose--hexose-1-phosphate uridylyltransferase